MLHIRQFTLALGVTWGVASLLLGWAAMFGWGEAIVYAQSSFYLGFDSSFIGGIIGGIWGFICGCVTGFVFSWLYNFFGHSHKKPKKK